MNQDLLLEFILEFYGYECYDFNFRNYMGDDGLLQIHNGVLQNYVSFYFTN